MDTLSYRVLCAVLLFCLHIGVMAQRIETPDGEAVLTVNTLSGNSTIRLTATRSTVYSCKYSAGEWSKAKELYQTPALRRIVDAHLKTEGSGDVRQYVVLLDDGTTMVFSYNMATESFSNPAGDMYEAPQAPQGQQQYRKVLAGNEIALHFSSTFYRYSANDKDWVQDTAGLNRVNIQDIALGASSVFLAGTNRGLFRFNSGTSSWSRINSFDSTATVSSVYATRNGRIFISAQNKGVYFSTDNGGTWQMDTAGLGTTGVARFADDNANTMYAVVSLQGNVSALYRKNDNASPWVQIDQPLRDFITQQPRINDISGEQMVELATSFGNITSTDKGASWASSIKGIMSEDISGVQFLGNNVTLVSTVLGIYRKQGADWTKVYPSNGYLSGRPLYRSENPVKLYTQIAGAGGLQGAIFTSTDAGATWQVDSVGLSTLPGSTGFSTPVLYVDRKGRKHIGVSSTQTQPLRFYSENPTWAIDTVGLNRPSGGNGTDFCSAIHTDANFTDQYFSAANFGNQGNINTTLLFKRPYIGGSWALDTAGLGRTLLISMVSDKKNVYGGGALVGGSASLYRKTATGWDRLPLPPAAVSDTRAMMIDSAGALYVAYTATLSNNAPNRGVYVTDNNGSVWDYAGLDGIPVRGLTATADAGYAFTNRGVYKLSRQILKAASIQLDKHTINFDTLSINATRDSLVTITNTGNDTLRVTNVRVNSQHYSVTPTQFSLAPGASRQITVTFAPKALGALTTTLRTVSNTLQDTIYLTGQGVKSNNANLQVLTKVLAFGEVGVNTSKDSTATILNNGTDTLHITNIISTNPLFTVPVTAFSVPPDQEYSFAVRFTPTALGSVTGRLRILSNTLPDSLTVIGGGGVVSVGEDMVAQQMQLRLSPNPATATVDVHLSLPQEQNIRITLTNIIGQEVATLFDGMVASGRQTLALDLQHIEDLMSGVYYCRIHTKNGVGGMNLLISR